MNSIMEQIKINIPAGYEINLEKSNLSKGIIYFKPKKISYKNISEKLFYGGSDFYFTDAYGSIIKNLKNHDTSQDSITDPNNSTSKEQLESILALNKLCNVAKFLNGDWVPSIVGTKYLIGMEDNNKLYITWQSSCIQSHCYFKTEELAQQAIDILGEEEIRKALTLNH